MLFFCPPVCNAFKMLFPITFIISSCYYVPLWRINIIIYSAEFSLIWSQFKKKWVTANDVTNFSFLANKHHWQCQKHIACQMQCFIFQTITFPFFRHIVFLLYYYLHRWMKSKRMIETIFMNKMWPFFSNVSTICFFSSFPRCRLEFDLSSYWKVFLLKCVVCPVSFAVIWFMKKDSRNISTLFFIQNKWNFKFDLKWTQFSLLWSELNFFSLAFTG